MTLNNIERSGLQAEAQQQNSTQINKIVTEKSSQLSNNVIFFNDLEQKQKCNSSTPYSQNKVIDHSTIHESDTFCTTIFEYMIHHTLKFFCINAPLYYHH